MNFGARMASRKGGIERDSWKSWDHFKERESYMAWWKGGDSEWEIGCPKRYATRSRRSVL